MVVPVGFGRTVALGAGCGWGGFAAVGGGVEGRIVLVGAGGDVLVTVGSTAGRIVIGGEAMGSGADAGAAAIEAAGGGGAGGGAGAVGSSGTTGAALAAGDGSVTGGDDGGAAE